ALTTVADLRGPENGASPPGSPPPFGSPSPAVIVRRALAHWRAAAVVMVLCPLALAQGVPLRKLLFKSQTLVLYPPGIAVHDAANSNEAPRTLGATLKELLFSQSNLRKVIDEQHLYPDVVEKRGYSDAAELFKKQIDWKARSNDTFALSFQGS